jgi:RNA polymerase sigma-70 factor (ECF subfamily)
MAESSPYLTVPLPSIAARPSSEAALSIEALVDLHGDFVWRSLRRLGVPESQADDAAQQVFVVAARKLGTILPGRERAFLFATLSNVAAHVRRSFARNREMPDDGIDDVVDAAPRPDELMVERQARALLDEVLDTMDSSLRAVFVLFALEELTAPEIAELTGVPVGTVASRLRRARDEVQRAARRVRASRATRGTP